MKRKKSKLCVLLSCLVIVLSALIVQNIVKDEKVRALDGRDGMEMANKSASWVTPTPPPHYSERVLPDGEYIIANTTRNGDNLYILDIAGFSRPASENTNVALYENEDGYYYYDGIEDTWTIKYENGYYTIKQNMTGWVGESPKEICLDLESNTPGSGTNVLVKEFTSADTQKWLISKNGKNGYRIQSKIGEYSLGVKTGEIWNNSNVCVWGKNNGDEQSWILIPYNRYNVPDEGTFALKSALGSEWTMGYQGSQAGTKMQIRKNAKQFFYMDNCGGEFKLFREPKQDNTYITVDVESSPLGAHTYWSNYTSHSWKQAWALVATEYGYALVSRYNGMALEVPSLENGADLVLNYFTGAKNQSWIFEEENPSLLPGSDPVLPDGDYIIANTIRDGDKLYMLDIEGSSVPAENGTNVSLYRSADSKYLTSGIENTWTIKYENGYYTIKQNGTEICLDLESNSPGDGANVLVNQASSSDTQKWVISRHSWYGYQIESKIGGYSLTVNSGRIKNGVNIGVCHNEDSDAQSWMLIPYTPSYPQDERTCSLVSALGSEWTMGYQGEPDSAKIQILKDSTQNFSLRQDGGGYYSILSQELENKVIATKIESSPLGAHACFADDNSSYWLQQWALVPTEYGYALVSRNNGMALEVPSLENGKVLVMNYFTGAKNQSWIIGDAKQPILPGYDRVLPDGNYIIAKPGREGNYLQALGYDVFSQPSKENLNVQLFATSDANVLSGYYNFYTWTIKYENGYYSIKTNGEEISLALENASPMNGTNVLLKQGSSSDTQKWVISPNGNNGYRIESKIGGYSLGATMDSSDHNASVLVKENSDEQSWILIPHAPSYSQEEGVYILTSSLATEWTIGYEGDPANAEMQLLQDSEQSFYLDKCDGGYYMLRKSILDDMVIAVKNDSSLLGAHTYLTRSALPSWLYLWALVPTEYGYALVSRYSGLALEVSSSENGTSLVMNYYTGAINQSWIIEEPQFIITETEKAIRVFESFQFEVENAFGQAVNWSVENTYIATVDENGKVTGKSVGNTYLYAKTADGRTAQCLIKVLEPTPPPTKKATPSPTKKVTPTKKATPTPTQIAKPGKPTGVKAVSASATSVKVSWDAVTGATGYQVWRAATKDGKYTAVGSVTTTSRVCSGLTTGSTYYFKVRAYKEVNGTKVYGSYSSIVSAAPKPAAPSGAKAVSASATSIKVSWKAVSGATGYQVWRATTKDGTYKAVGSVTTTERVCSGLTCGTTYYFKVRAYKEVNGTKVYGAYSSIVSAIPKPAAPTGVKVTVNSATKVTVSWSKVTGATGYEVFRSTSKDGTYSKLGTVTETSRACPGLKSGTTYYFKVRAYKTVNGVKVYSAYSTVVSATPKK